jgi:putative heme-binding domain-containing protein
LIDSRAGDVRSLAHRLFRADRAGSRSQVLAEYKAALSAAADPGRGSIVFRRECAACHRVGEVGHAVGPDLTTSSSRDAEELLTHILDPNKYVLPNYMQYQVADNNGRVTTGLIVSQTAASITLRGADDRSETILRSNVAELASTGRSLMPEGFEATITTSEMVDLISYLQSIQSASPSAGTPLAIGTEPGLIEP